MVEEQVSPEINCEALSQSLSSHTRRAYHRWVREYIAEKLPNMIVDWEHIQATQLVPMLTVVEFKIWLGQLKTRDLGKQSLDQAHAAILFLCRCLVDTYPEADYYTLLSNLKGVELPRAEIGRRRRTWYDRDQLARLLKTAAQFGVVTALDARNMPMLMLMALCGLRRDELVKARWSDLNKQGNNMILQVHGKGSHLRQVKVPDEVVKVLIRWKNRQRKAADSEVVFTRIRRGDHITAEALSTQAVMDIVKSTAEKADLPTISPHDLRRTFARGAYEAGASFELIRQTLGHANIGTTEKYINAVQELEHAATDIMAGALKKSAEAKKKTIISIHSNVATSPEISPTINVDSALFTDQDLLTRHQAAQYLGISIFQFDTLKKRAKIEAVRSTE